MEKKYKYKSKSKFFIPKVDFKEDYESFSDKVSWAIRDLKIENLWQKTLGKNVVVWVMDSGVDVSHVDLNVNKSYYFSKDGDKPGNHGTHVAGILNGKHNGDGVKGICPESLLNNVKVLDSTGNGVSASFIKGAKLIKDSISQYPPEYRHIINISAGSKKEDKEFYKILKELDSKGVLIICAGGNSGQNTELSYPAKWDFSVAVGFSNEREEIDLDSSSGVDISAPGVDVESTIVGSKYATYSGSSMAAPFVSGLCALILSYFPFLTTEQVWTALKETAKDLKSKGYDKYSGHGLVQPEEAFIFCEINFSNLNKIKLIQNKILNIENDLNYIKKIIEDFKNGQ